MLDGTVCALLKRHCPPPECSDWRDIGASGPAVSLSSDSVEYTGYLSHSSWGVCGGAQSAWLVCVTLFGAEGLMALSSEVGERRLAMQPQLLHLTLQGFLHAPKLLDSDPQRAAFPQLRVGGWCGPMRNTGPVQP